MSEVVGILKRARAEYVRTGKAVASIRAATPDLRSQAWAMLRVRIAARAGEPVGSFSLFAAVSTHAEVLAAFDKAILSLEKDAAE